MKLRLKWNITTKLILINAVILFIVGGIIFVVNASFQSIQTSLTKTIHEDVSQVIQNARLSRELNRTFTEINTLIRGVYDEELPLDKESQALLQNVRMLSQQELDTQMQTLLQDFSQDLQRLFAQGIAIRENLEQLDTISHELLTTLTELEEILAEKMITLMMEGHDPLSVSQMSALIPSYRETLLQIKIQLSSIQQEHSGKKHADEPENPLLVAEEQHSIIFSFFDDLLLRFRTLLAGDLDIAKYGQTLINGIQRYKEQVMIFHDALQKLDLQIIAINEMQEDMLSIMRKSDDRIAEAAGTIQQHITQVIGRSKEIIMILSSVIFIVLLFGWLITHWMTRPLLDLSFAAERLADGDLECNIQDIKSRDEIGILARAFKNLVSYFQEMAYTATEISHGNLNLEVHPRSSKDVFGNRFQQMISYLKDIGGIASQVAEGDLRSQVQLQSQNDQLGNAFANMQEGLVDLIGGIRSGADHLSSISTQVLSTSSRNSEALAHIGNAADVTSSAMREMKSSAEEVHLSTEHLRSSVEETSSSITEMITSVKHVAENSRKLSGFADSTVETVSQIAGSLETVAEQAEHSKTLAKATTEDAASGQHSVEQMITKMDAISGVTENISSIISRFEQRSMEIGTILDVINEVADQTSLLALNASIIAAQAGTHGRGFAVVADEIKGLANRVGTSTNEIGKIIKRFQSDSSEAAKAIEQGRHEVESGVDIAKEAGAALHKIGQSAANSSHVAADIAVLVRQETMTSTQMADSMKDVANMIAEITQATEEQENNSSQLLSIVENMQMLAEQVLRAMQEQQQSTRHVTEFMEDVTALVSQNKPTVEQLARTAHELAAQAEDLKGQVERFVVPDNRSLVHHSSKHLEEYDASSERET